MENKYNTFSINTFANKINLYYVFLTNVLIFLGNKAGFTATTLHTTVNSFAMPGNIRGLFVGSSGIQKGP